MPRRGCRSGLIALTVVASMLLLAGCSRRSAYFPMNAGLTLHYQVLEQGDLPDGHPIFTQLVSSYLPPRRSNGRAMVPESLDYPGQATNLRYLEQRSDGVFEYATQGPQEAEPVPDPQEVVLLKYPLKTGLAWDTQDIHFSLLNQAAYRLNLHVVIQSMDDTLTVPAGTFTHCLRLVRTGIVPPAPTARLVPVLHVEETEWYAPNIGLVRFNYEDRWGTPPRGSLVQGQAVMIGQLKAVSRSH